MYLENIDLSKWDSLVKIVPKKKKMRRDAKLRWSNVVQLQGESVKRRSKDTLEISEHYAAIEERDTVDQIHVSDRPIRFLVTVSPGCNGYEVIQKGLFELMEVDLDYARKSPFCSQIKVNYLTADQTELSLGRSIDLSCHFTVSLPLSLKRTLKKQDSDPDYIFQLAAALEGKPYIDEVFPDLPFSNLVAPLQASIPGCTVPESDASDHSDWAIRMVNFDPSAVPETGKGIRIGQIDSGYTDHPELNIAQNYDLDHDLDVVDEDSTAFEPGGRQNGSHGTATGSIISSEHGTEIKDHLGRMQQGVNGIAPNAAILPIRAFHSVVTHWFSFDITQAVRYLATQNCDVITMSFGGMLPRATRNLLREAYENNVILCAAAGNCVGWVVQPAKFDFVIGCGATGIDKETGVPHVWRGSSSGRGVDICAPGENVYVANWHNTEARIIPSQGTSFAAPHVAGAAALWLEKHGKDNLVDTLPSGKRLSDLFREAIQATATIPDDWETNNDGAGILNIQALLNWPIP